MGKPLSDFNPQRIRS